MTLSNVQVLDCTIRDGNYAVDCQFTAEDTAILAAGLSAVGIKHIEVGHGLGLGGDRQSVSTSATTDMESIKAARQAIQAHSVVGCFFIPSIGSYDEMRSAVDAGLQFIRLGADIDRYTELESSIKLARSLGLEVWGNLMKSYIATPERFARAVCDLAEMGAQAVALVDSAGGMTPDQVAQYTQASLSLTDTPLGFHGHDNLRLAVANCLRFVECGGQFVDGSLGGIGRSSGNAATELLIALLARKGLLDPGIQWEALLEFADEFLGFSVPHRPSTNSCEAAMGLGFVHSGFESIINKAAAENGTTPARTVLRLPQSANKSVSPEVAKTAAIAAVDLSTSTTAASSSLGIGITRRSQMNRSEPDSLTALNSILAVETGKWSRKSVASVVLNSDCQRICLRPLRSTPQILVAHIEIADTALLQEIYAALKHSVDVWLFDHSIDRGLWADSTMTSYGYNDDLLVEQACLDTLQAIGARKVRWLGRVGDNDKPQARLAHISAEEATENLDAVIVTGTFTSPELLDITQIKTEGHLVLAAAGLVCEDTVETARGLGIKVVRIDYGPALLAEAERLIRTHERTSICTGEVLLPDGLNVVAGGQVGPAGAIIVDSIISPRFILGMADGTGGVAPLNSGANDELPRVHEWIYGHWVQSVS